MAHHRWFASGAGSDQPHQPAAAGNERDGISDQATNACGTTTSSPPAASNNHDVSELRGNSPTAVDGSRRRELPWRKRKHPLGKVGLVAVAGAFGLLLACERLTSTLDFSAGRSTPFSRLKEPLEKNKNDDPRNSGVSETSAPAWVEAVAGCTGAEDGFVYGGEAGNVLTFVREGKGGGGGPDRPTLPDVLEWFWRLKHDRGVLAYEVAKLEERRDTGSETGWKVIFASNIGRNKPFPAAGPAEVAWDPSSFNFYKANPSEFLLSYTPSFRHEREGAAAAAAAASAAGETRLLGDGVAAPMERHATVRGAGARIAAETTGLNSVSSVGCREASTVSPPQDAVLVNIRPVGPVSLLLTPGYPHSHNQRATAESLAVAMDFAEALGVDPGFRLGFNSAGSSSSVNHLHFQCWYFDAGPGGLPIEASETMHAATLPFRGGDAVEVHTLVGYPIRTLVFHTLGKDLEAVGEVIEGCIDFLVEENTPHTVVFSTGRAFLLPRQHLEEPPFAVVPGFAGVSGEVVVTKEQDFGTITADQVFDWWRDKVGVSVEHFDRITDGCLK